MSSISLRSVIGIGSALMALAIAVCLPVAYAAQQPGAVRLAWLVVVCAVIGGGLGLSVRRLALRLLDHLLAEQSAESQRFHTTIDNILQGVCFFDGQQRLIFCNLRYAEMYGLTADQVRPGTTLREIVEHRFNAGCFPDMTRDAYIAWRNSIAISDRPSDTVTTLKNGRVHAIHHQPMPDGGWVATHADITEQRRTQEQIERMARCDALTGLSNRVQFRERLHEALQQGMGTSTGKGTVAVLIIDLDRFKAVNDTLGHPVGDQLLCAAAQRLALSARLGDLVARLGGDEFAIIQAGAPQPAAARSLAERLVHEFAQPFDLGGHQVRVGVSVGVVLSPDDGADPDDLLKKADLALYDAKSAGRGRQRFFTRRCSSWRRAGGRWRSTCARPRCAVSSSCTISPSSRSPATSWSASRRSCAGATRCAAW